MTLISIKFKNIIRYFVFKICNFNPDCPDGSDEVREKRS